MWVDRDIHEAIKSRIFSETNVFKQGRRSRGVGVLSILKQASGGGNRGCSATPNILKTVSASGYFTSENQINLQIFKKNNWMVQEKIASTF